MAYASMGMGGRARRAGRGEGPAAAAGPAAEGYLAGLSPVASVYWSVRAW